MINDNQELKYRSNNILGVLAGMLVGGLVGAITALLFAPQSGKDTRMQIREKSIELRDQATEMMENTMAQARSNANRIMTGGLEKIKELKQHGQELAVEQLEHVSEAAQAGKKAIRASQA